MSDDESPQYQKDFDGILDYIDTINSLETDDVPAQNVLKNVVREDGDPYEVGSYSKDILSDAPDTQNGYFKVNKIL